MQNQRKFILLLVLILVFSVACGGDDGEEAEAEPTAVPPTATLEPIVIATAVPTEEPAAEAAEPTAVPTEETAAPEAEEAAAPAKPRIGLLRFRDNAEAASGDFQLLLENVDPAPAGSHYELWLTDDQGTPVLNLGPFEANSNVQFSGSTTQHLLGNHAGALITIEPDNIEDGELGTIAFTGAVPAGSLLHVRHVVFQFPQNPNGQGFLVGAQEQTALAFEHAQLLQNELAAGNMSEARRHAEHVINILDGEAGSFFGDLDGDNVPQNPGDGVGVRGYVSGGQQHAQLAADAEDTTAEVQLHAGHVIVSGDNALLWLDDAVQAAIGVLASDSAEEAQPNADTLANRLDLMLNGVDANDDGAVAPIEGEGGILTAYEHALNMGSFEIFAADANTVAVAPAAPAPAEEAAGNENNDENANEETAAPPVNNAVVIEMTNFSFQSNNVTIPVGTTVTWVNTDEAQHSATAVDGSFDTGLFGSGDEASVTFDKPGTYVYYCLLHGAPDGSGMVGTITVTGDDTDAAAAPPPAEEESAPAAVSIDMLDFEFGQANLTVTAGTAVTWINQGDKPHTATADDGSFNTNRLEPGQSATITFDQPGTYAYYCELHGGPGGQGMSATITVVDG